MTRVIVDTGPLVALLNRKDSLHLWAREVFDGLEPPLFSCEAVISEACFLVRRIEGGPSAVLELVTRGLVDIGFSAQAEFEPIRRLMNRYVDVPMSFADACLVRMSELAHKSQLLTVDADFGIYRRNRRQVIPLLRPR